MSKREINMVGCFCNIKDIDHPSATHDRYAVGYLQHFRKSMGYENDGLALPFQPPEKPEESGGLLRGED